MPRVGLILGLALALFALWASPASAADQLYLLTHGDQDAIVIGEVARMDEALLTLSPARTIAGLSVEAPLVIDQKAIRPALHTGDFVVASVDSSGNAFAEKWGVFKVSGDDPATLRVLAGPYPPGDLLAVQRYIRSGGRDNDFARKGDSVYLRHPDGTSELIYPVPGQPVPMQWTETPAPGQPGGRSQTGWRLEYLALAAAVLALIFFLIRYRPRPPSRTGEQK